VNKYFFVRAVYRRVDRWLLRRLPARFEERIRQIIFPLARKLFPDRVKARSAREFVGSARADKPAIARLPAWAESEVMGLVELEPMLASLVAEDAQVEPYAIPWDMNYVGLRYADARRALDGRFATLVLAGAHAQVEQYDLRSLPRPMAIIDVSDEGAWAAPAKLIGANYAALRAEYLDATDHCAVLARLVLQVAPREVRQLPDPIIDRCVDQHGAAMASVTTLVPMETDEMAGSRLDTDDLSGTLGICVQELTKTPLDGTSLPAGSEEN
jgi:hypothetical protein